MIATRFNICANMLLKLGFPTLEGVSMLINMGSIGKAIFVKQAVTLRKTSSYYQSI